MDYIKALERAIIYIENHLDEDLRVEDAARAAGYSYYHFTRQFAAVLGESVGSYIKKRRLSDAAKQLLYTDRRILDIALDHGFESGESFSRAFKSVYKASPASYRKNRLNLFIASKPRLDFSRIDYIARRITAHPRITELPEIKVAGLRGRTTLHDNVIPDLWASFNAIAGEVPDVVPGARGFGICEACAEQNNLYTMDDTVFFSEVAGIEVSRFDRLKPPFTGKVLRPGRYAVFTHTGSLENLTQTFEYIWGTWFLVTGEQLDDREDFELYDERYLGYYHPQSQIDLYIPLR